MKIGPQHLLSVSRVFLGAFVCATLGHTDRSWWVLPAVLTACAADFCDGRLARRLHAESEVGRLIDNLCDAAFLAFAFWGFAEAATWSEPSTGSAARYWHDANWLPLIALALSFGTYLLRWAVAARRGAKANFSLRGHHAGILNYALTVAGGVAVLPGVTVTPWLLEPLFVSVSLFNAAAAVDSLRRFGGERDRPT